jgi:hypothetical protein
MPFQWTYTSRLLRVKLDGRLKSSGDRRMRYRAKGLGTRSTSLKTGSVFREFARRS